MVIDETIELVVQVNGKLRARLPLPANVAKEDALAAARADEHIARWLEDKTIVKEIFVPKKLVNFVVR